MGSRAKTEAEFMRCQREQTVIHARMKAAGLDPLLEKLKRDLKYRKDQTKVHYSRPAEQDFKDFRTCHDLQEAITAREKELADKKECQELGLPWQPCRRRRLAGRLLHYENHYSSGKKGHPRYYDYIVD